MSDVLDGTVPSSYFADSVECHANAISAFTDNKLIKSAPVWIEAVIAGVTALAFGMVMSRRKIRTFISALFGIIIVYLLIALAVFSLTSIRLSILYIPIGIVIQFFVFLLVRYVELQKKRADEMQKMLFSMADSMTEAIEGRTPCNANHTKNVAKRCIEMLDYINQMHKEKRTDMHFSQKDKNQLYLAAMLHDISKMDVLLEVMDKPTKLGHREAPLRSRLQIIMSC